MKEIIQLIFWRGRFYKSVSLTKNETIKTLILETDNENDHRLLTELVKRLGIKSSEKSGETIDEQLQLFKRLFGSWQSEKSGNEIVN